MKKLYLTILILTITFCATSQESKGNNQWIYQVHELTDEVYIIDVFIENDKLYGVILATYPPSPRERLCIYCKGYLKKRPLVGLQIISGLDKYDDGWYGQNGFLDTNNGKLYDCSVWFDNDEYLILRTYIKDLYKTQVWYKNLPGEYGPENIWY